MPNPSMTDQAPSEGMIANYVRNGQGFACNGRGVTATNPNLLNCALSLFNPSNSGKSVLIYSIRCLASTTAGTLSQWNFTTSDPYNTTGFTAQLTPVHLQAGVTVPATVVSACQTASGNTTTVAAPGTKVEEFILTAGVSGEILNNSAVVVLPPGNGMVVMIYVGTATGYFQSFAKWIEY
ncbi:MAG TPA: hypothetical protein VH593_17335 [Ktedonobacteraceae bacterium]